MDRREFVAASGVAAVAAVPLLAQAGSEVVGSWIATITADKPALGSFDSLMTFHHGGVFTETRRSHVPGTPLGDLLGSNGHGAWKLTGKGYEARFRVLLQRAPISDGAPAGTDDIRISVELDSESQRLEGTFESTVRDASNKELLTVNGTVSGVRIDV